MQKVPHKKVVLIGGAGGVGTMIKALRPLKNAIHISVIQSPADDGGSAGAVRRQFNILPPGDVRRTLLRLSQLHDPHFLEAFEHRFESGPLKGQVVGNLVLAGLTMSLGSFEKAIEAAKKIFNVTDDIIPASLTPATLNAKLENGQIIEGETNIDVPARDGNVRIARAWFSKQVGLNPRAKKAIKHADLIVLGPGDLYTSVVPNLLVSGMPEAIKTSKAQKVFVINSCTKYGETPFFTASDFIGVITQYLGAGILTYAIANNHITDLKGEALYSKDSIFTVPDTEKFPDYITPIVGRFVREDKPAWFDPAAFTPVFKKLLAIR